MSVEEYITLTGLANNAYSTKMYMHVHVHVITGVCMATCTVIINCLRGSGGICSNSLRSLVST